MKSIFIPQNKIMLNSFIVSCAVLLSTLATAADSTSFVPKESILPPSGPLVLSTIGSFFIGGETVYQTPVQLSSPFGTPLAKGGSITKNQMYVQYMEPQAQKGSPLILVHGATLSGKTFETTPDGRMGWEEYFVRRGHTVYVPDQIGRARSGQDIAIYNDVRAGIIKPDSLPNVFRLSNELGWGLFRFGNNGHSAFSDEKFPIKAVEQFAKQSVPDYFWSLPTPNPNYKALADLAVRAKGAVLMGHSQAGSYPLDAALINSAGLKGLVLIEPGYCGDASYSDSNYLKLAKLPILVVFGDHLNSNTGIAGFSWKDTFKQCESFIKKINLKGGNAQMLHTLELGIHGNSHMIMQDQNNLEIADLILQWVTKHIDNNTIAY
jgi:pimeloyl-ACP methyl ester carboxylesterase